MGAIPDDIKEGLQNLSKSKKIEVKILVNELKEIIANDETIKTMPPEQEEFKIRYAWALLCRRHTSGGQTGQLYIKALSKPRHGKTKAGKSRLDLFAMVKRITKDEDENEVIGDIELGAGTLWEKAADAAQKISKDKVYKVTLTTADLKTDVMTGIKLGGNDATFVETTETTFPTNEDFYKTHIEPKEGDIKIDLDEMDLHARSNEIDIRVVKVMIIDHRVGVSATTQREYGQYVVTDNSLLGAGDDKKPGSVTVWLDPEEVEYEKGVMMKQVGSITYNKEKEKANWTYFFGIPVGTAVKRKVEQKPVEKETEDVDLDSLDEPVDVASDVPTTTDDDLAI